MNGKCINALKIPKFMGVIKFIYNVQNLHSGEGTDNNDAINIEDEGTEELLQGE